MCGRFIQAFEPNEISERLASYELTTLLDPSIAHYSKSFNISPSQAPICIYSSEESLRIGLASWGFRSPYLPDDTKIRPINSRVETLLDKPLFREAAQRRRCIVPASGYYEWKAQEGAPKTPYAIFPRDDLTFFLAGILGSSYTTPNGELPSFAIITTQATNTTISAIHHRQPLMLLESQIPNWLYMESITNETLRSWSSNMAVLVHEVSKDVNNPRNDGPSLSQPLS